MGSGGEKERDGGRMGDKVITGTRAAVRTRLPNSSADEHEVPSGTSNCANMPGKDTMVKGMKVAKFGTRRRI